MYISANQKLLLREDSIKRVHVFYLFEMLKKTQVRKYNKHWKENVRFTAR